VPGIIMLVTISLLIMISLTLLEPSQLIQKNIIPVLLTLLSIALTFVFIRIERKVINPVLKIDYFNNRNLLLVFIICILFGMLFSASFLIPTHAEWIFGLSF